MTCPWCGADVELMRKLGTDCCGWLSTRKPKPTPPPRSSGSEPTT